MLSLGNVTNVPASNLQFKKERTISSRNEFNISDDILCHISLYGERDVQKLSCRLVKHFLSNQTKKLKILDIIKAIDSGMTHDFQNVQQLEVHLDLAICKQLKSKKTLSRLKSLFGNMGNVEKLLIDNFKDFYNHDILSDGLLIISSLPNLKTLTIGSHISVTNESFLHLKSIHGIRELRIMDSSNLHSGFSHAITHLKSLSSLSLLNCNIDRQDLCNIRDHLIDLKILHISTVEEFNFFGMEEIARFRSLNELSIIAAESNEYTLYLLLRSETIRNLEKLTLKFNVFDSFEFKKSYPFWSDLHSIKYLELSLTKLNWDDVCHILRGCKNLVHIETKRFKLCDSILRIPLVEQKDFDILSKWYMVPKIEIVTDVVIQRSNWNQRVKQILQKFTSVRYFKDERLNVNNQFEIQMNDIDDETVNIFAENPLLTLGHSIKISNSEVLTDMGIERLVKNFSNISCISLNKTPKLTKKTIEVLSLGFSLRKLEIFNNRKMLESLGIISSILSLQDLSHLNLKSNGNIDSLFFSETKERRTYMSLVKKMVNQQMITDAMNINRGVINFENQVHEMYLSELDDILKNENICFSGKSLFPLEKIIANPCRYQGINRMFKFTNEFKVLTLERDTTFGVVEKLKSQFKNVESLTLKNCLHLDDNTMDIISTHAENLTSLSLSFSKQITDQSVFFIATRMKALKKLTLTGIDITTKSLQYLTNRDYPVHRFLEVLDLTWCYHVKSQDFLQLSSLPLLNTVNVSGIKGIDKDVLKKFSDVKPSVKIIQNHLI